MSQHLFATGLVVGAVLSGVLFSWLGYRYGSKAVNEAVRLGGDLSRAEATVKKDLGKG